MSLQVQSAVNADTLADVLDPILDKGAVVAGKIPISLVGIELLTSRLRLQVATVDKAKEMGINWSENDPALSADAHRLAPENGAPTTRLTDLESRLAEIGA